MEKATFIESIIKVLKIISSMPLFIEILILSLLLTVAMTIFYFKKTKIGKKTTIIIYVVTLVLLPITHISFFINTIDKMIENLVEIIYFPSVYAYILMIILTDVFLLMRLLNKKFEKWYVALEFVYFFVFQFLFFLALRLAVTNGIDVFDKASIYHNSNLTSVIQILSYLFWIRIFVILIKFAINKIAGYETKKNKKENTVNNFNHNNIENDDKEVFEPVPDIYGNKQTSSVTNDFDSNLQNIPVNNLVDNEKPVLDQNITEFNNFNNNLVTNSSLDVNENNESNLISNNKILDEVANSNSVFNWDNSNKLNDLVSNNTEEIITDNNQVSNNDYRINNLDVMDTAGRTNTHFSIKNEPSLNNNAFNQNKTFINDSNNISSIQNSNNYDLNSVLSNISFNNNLDNTNTKKQSEVPSVSILDDYNDSKNKFYDDFYE